jgi:hypothetical protein
MQTVVGSKDPNLGSNALNRPSKVPNLEDKSHTGHGRSNEVFDPNEINQPGRDLGLDIPRDTAHRDHEEPYITNVFAAKAGEIPGVDIPFRKVNPKYPANQDVLDEVRALQDKIRTQRDDKYDCSEIAEDLLKTAKGKGKIIEVLPPKGTKLTLYELGRERDFTYHQVYSDGQYVYDPRLSSDPIPKGDWQIMVKSLNPGAVFK